MARRIAVTLAAGLVLVGLMAVPTAAVSCVGPLPDPGTRAGMDEIMKKYPTVFTGTVINTKGNGDIALVAVDKVLKGNVASVVEVHGGQGRRGVASSADRRYERGGRYLFTSPSESAPFKDHACTATSELTPQIADLAKVGSAPTQAGSSDIPVVPVALGLGGALGLAGLARLVTRHLARAAA